jgi:hypothetical protein
VTSRDSSWWGFCLYHPLHKDRLKQQIDSHMLHPLQSLCEDVRVCDPLPSFYFPEYVERFDDCPEDLRDAATVIVLDWNDNNPGALKQVGSLLDDFCQTKFFFIQAKLRQQEHRQQSLQVHITGRLSGNHQFSTDPEECILGRAEDLLPNWQVHQRECIELAEQLKFPLRCVSLTIAIPPEHSDLPPGETRFYSYLPTDVLCGFSILVHADFFLDNSRKAIDFNKPLNAHLIEHTADLLLNMLLTDPRVSRRPDLWKFLNPTGAAEPLVRAIQARLFAPDSAANGRLQQLLHITFPAGEPQPPKRYQMCFEAMSAWKSQLTSAIKRADARRRQTEALLYRHVRAAGVECIPVVVEGDQVKVAVRLPDVDASGRKMPGGRTVFYSRSQLVLERVFKNMSCAPDDVASVGSWRRGSWLRSFGLNRVHPD